MIFTKLRLIQIRSFADTTIEPSDTLTLLTGLNGAGKTNLLEGVYYASLGKSFRTSNDTDLIRVGDAEGTILLDYRTRDVAHTIKIRLARGEAKKFFLNDNPIRRKELMGLFRTVLFTPDELQLIKGAPQMRRRFLDTSISQVSPRYYETLLRYTRAVQQRNAAFKNALATGQKPDVDIWDMQIAEGAAYLTKKRLDTVESLNAAVPGLQETLTGGQEKLEIRYKQRGETEVHTDVDWFIGKLLEKRDEDARRAYTSVGPHRDDLQFLLNGMDLSAYGSQGQMRTAVLSMKLAEMEFIKEETGEYPVLLLDDIGSELDTQRKSALLQYLTSKHIQTLVTGTDASFGEGKVIEIGKTAKSE